MQLAVASSYDEYLKIDTGRLRRELTAIGASITDDDEETEWEITHRTYGFKINLSTGAVTDITVASNPDDTPTGEEDDENSTITYNANNGTFSGGESSNVAVYSEDSNGTYSRVSGSYLIPSRDGYVFGGWTTSSDGSGTVYINESTAINNETTTAGTLYASWEYIGDLSGTYGSATGHYGISFGSGYVGCNLTSYLEKGYSDLIADKDGYILRNGSYVKLTGEFTMNHGPNFTTDGTWNMDATYLRLLPISINGVTYYGLARSKGGVYTNRMHLINGQADIYWSNGAYSDYDNIFYSRK